MRDAILADELRRPLAVLRIDAHDARRQRAADGPLVFEFEEHGRLQLLSDLGVTVAVVPVIAGQQVLAAHRHGAGREQRELLGLVVGDRGRPLEAVEVVVHQRLLRRLGRLGARRGGCGHGIHPRVRLARPVHRAGHQLQRRIVEAGAAAVGQRHPAVEVEALAVGGEVGNVIGLPGQTAGEVGKLDGLLAAGGFEQDRERRPVAQVGRHGIEGQAPGHAGLDAVGKAQHRALAGGEYRRGFAPLGVAGRVWADHRDLAADVFFQQLLRCQQVEVEVLFDEGERWP